MLKPGDDVDSWCGKCKLMLAHTIEAMADKTPARVHCNTCGAQHKYRRHKPGEGARKRAASSRKPRATPYEKLLDGKDRSKAKTYSPQDTYLEGDLVEHARFGLGVTTTVKSDDKIEVVFQDSVKTLVHSR